MEVFLGHPSPPLPSLETSRTFFDSAETPEAFFILHALRLSVVYKIINVHLGQGQDLIMSIQIYFKYKYTYEKVLDFVYFVQMTSKY